MGLHGTTCPPDSILNRKPPPDATTTILHTSTTTATFTTPEASTTILQPTSTGTYTLDNNTKSTSSPQTSGSDPSTTTGTTTTMGNTENTGTTEGSNITIIIVSAVIAIPIICIIIIIFISVRYFSPRYKNNTSTDIALREGHTASHGQVMCEETGQVHYSTVQSNVDDPSDQTNQFTDDQTNQFTDDQNVEQPPAQLLSIQVDGEKKIISTATQEETPPLAFAVYSQEKRNEGRKNESTPSLNPEPIPFKWTKCMLKWIRRIRRKLYSTSAMFTSGSALCSSRQE